jgi:hypothetical protein
MAKRKSVITFIILFALAVSLIGGIVPAYAAKSSDSLHYDDFAVYSEKSVDVVVDDVDEAVDIIDTFIVEPLTVQSEYDLVEQFVIRLYEIVLGREYDPAGLLMWSNALKNRVHTGTSVAHGFFFSPEFLNKNVSNEDYVRILYRTFLNREADPQGENTWLTNLRMGVPRENVFAGFTNSSEFGRRCDEAGILRGTYTPPPGAPIRVFVTRLYQTTLGREPDPTGLNTWTNALMNNVHTGASVARGFIFSNEMNNRNLSNEDFVEVMYNALMGRPSDPGGKNTWVTHLNSGLPRENVFASFISSNEFAGICNNAGITRGSYTPPPGGPVRVFVTRMFRGIQGVQDPTAPQHIIDFNHWHSALMAGRETGASVAYSFIFNNPLRSPTELWNDSEFVNMLHTALLGRNPTDAERSSMLSLLWNGVSRYTVFVRVINSDEFARVCTEFGINRGTPPPPSNFLAGGSMLAKTWNFIRMANVAGISNRPEHIAGIIGNMRVETGYQLCPFQQQIGGNRAGLGLLQWTGERRVALENYMWNNGISQVHFVAEMNKHLDGQCFCIPIPGSPRPTDHPQALLDRVLEVQINFMFHELNTSERLYMEDVNAPSNRTGIAGARAYAELFCSLVLRPGVGIGEFNNLHDVGVQWAVHESQHYGGQGVSRVSFSRLDERRNNADEIYRQFLSDHG